ncbi:hypothetical protein BDN70DRAFT_898632 [Pholiota conissans]|uniref:Uncharacterized protein n=1 Tax=Pholiota conissans TaxID=109636 RepID=A0A9P5YUI9_9AGAR|nr:hypothetical protein BDN70DRAFT_898632 [Pholiota conissans]
MDDAYPPRRTKEGTGWIIQIRGQDMISGERAYTDGCAGRFETEVLGDDGEEYNIGAGPRDISNDVDRVSKSGIPPRAQLRTRHSESKFGWAWGSGGQAGTDAGWKLIAGRGYWKDGP